MVSWTEPTVTDNSGSYTLTSTHSPGSTYDIGNTTVTYTAIDESSNNATYSFDIIVIGRTYLFTYPNFARLCHVNLMVLWVMADHFNRIDDDVPTCSNVLNTKLCQKFVCVIVIRKMEVSGFGRCSQPAFETRTEIWSSARWPSLKFGSSTLVV